MTSSWRPGLNSLRSPLVWQRTTTMQNRRSSLEEQSQGEPGHDTFRDDGSGDVHEIHMQDLVAAMTVPCALSLLMGTRTITPDDFTPERNQMKPKLLASMLAIAPDGPTEEEKSAGAISRMRYLRFLDESTSTASLGFRIDAAKTVIGPAGADSQPEKLPLPNGLTLAKLREEADISTAFGVFLRNDAALAKAFLQKLEALASALNRSAFFPRHAFLRTTLLMVFDDTARTSKVELKMMNFGDAYALPAGEQLDHTAAWDGSATSHADGYLIGVQSLIRILKDLTTKLVTTTQKI